MKEQDDSYLRPESAADFPCSCKSDVRRHYAAITLQGPRAAFWEIMFLKTSINNTVPEDAWKFYTLYHQADRNVDEVLKYAFWESTFRD